MGWGFGFFFLFSFLFFFFFLSFFVVVEVYDDQSAVHVFNRYVSFIWSSDAIFIETLQFGWLSLIETYKVTSHKNKIYRVVFFFL